MNGSGPLSFDAIINDVNFRSQLDAMERRMMGFTSSTVRETSKIDQQFARLGQLALGAFSFGKLVELPAQIFKVRSEVQGLEIAFTTMLKSKAKADALLGDLRTFEANTPFGSQEVATGAKQLLAYGFAAKDIIPTLSTLGNVSAGLGLPLERLTYLFGTTKTQGRLFAQDLNQFIGSGIPLISELAKQFGVGEDAVRKLVEEGKVGFPQVKKALESLTTGGGIFAGTLDAQGKSLAGLAERLGSAYRNMLNDIGKQNEGVAFELINTATVAVEHYQEFVDVLSIIAASYGTYKAALIVTNVVQKLATLEQIRNTAVTQAQAIAQAEAASTSSALSVSQIRLATASAAASQAQAAGATLAARAQLLLNNVISANPYVLAATAIAGLVAAYFVFRNEVTEVKSALELLDNATKDVNASYTKQRAEVTTLTDVIKNQNVAESERKKAYDQLNSVAPEILKNLTYEKAKTADLTNELNLYLISLERKIRLEASQGAYKSAIEQELEATQRADKALEKYTQTQDALKKAQKNPTPLQTGPDARSGSNGAFIDAKAAEAELNAAIENKRKAAKVKADIKQTVESIYTGNSLDSVNAEIQNIEIAQSKLDKLSVAYKYNEDRINELTKTKEALIAADKKGQTVHAKTVDDINAEIKKLEELQGKQSSNGEHDKIQKQIDALQAQKRRITGELTKEQRRAAKDAENVGPLGSVSYYENIASKAKEALDKIPTSDKGKVAQQQAIILDATQKAEAARLAVTVRSFDEEIAYKRQQYELYQKWVEAYGKASADAQFGDLLDSGQSYLDYLNAQITALEKKREDGTLSKKGTQQLGILLDDRTDITGKKSGIDKFNEDLEKSRMSAINLADYLVILKAKQDDLSAKPNTADWFKVRQEVAEQIVGTQQDLRTQLTQYLTDVTGSEEQRLAVTKKYADLRASLEEQYRGKRTSVGKVTEYQGKLGSINKGESDEVKEINDRVTQASAAYKKLDEVILASGRKAMQQRLDLLNAYLEKEKGAVDTQTYQRNLKERNDLSIAIKDDDLARINEFGQLVGQLGEAYMELGGAVGDAGMFIAGFTSNLNLLTSAFKKNQTDADKAQTILSATVSIISSITSAAAQRKQAEEEYYRSVISQQTQYNLLLNEQTGTRSEKNESIFYKDYQGRIKDRTAQYIGAQKGYMNSLKELGKAQVKTGQRDKVDWSAAGKNALSGAAIGTAIAPGIGTAVGAVIGFAAGLFGAKKRADELGGLLETYPKLIQDGANGQKLFNTELAQSLIDAGLLDDSSKQLVQNTIDWTKKMEEAREEIRNVIKDLAGGLGDKLRDSLVNAFVEGTSAAKAFSDAVGDIIGNLVEQMLFSQVLGPSLKKLQEDMEASAMGGDGNFVDDITRFYQKAKDDKIAEIYTAGLDAIDKASKDLGIDVFKKNKNLSNPNSMSGAIKGVTEETASVLAGQISAIRITQADTNGVIKQQLLHLSNISTNSNYLVYLKSMDERLKNIESNGKSDPLRAAGIL